MRFSLSRGGGYGALLLALLPASCGNDPPPDEPVPHASHDELINPETCRGCHETHYAEWAGSMHAYASADPVFRAMNRRGQEETDGALGTFCVNCHAPMAVREGATADGLNLDEVPKALQGIGCYFCHSVQSVDGAHNNPLILSEDGPMRGGVRDPQANSVHRSEYSELFASTGVESSALCGACHDIVLPSPPAPAPVHLERTFEEWKGSIFAPPQAVDDTAALSCNGCHMRASAGEPIAQVPGLESKRRARHAHQFPGVDTTLTPFPDTGDSELDSEIAADQRTRVRDFLDSTLRIEICVLTRFTGDASIDVILDNAAAGHHFPSGAAQDRRAWVEVRAFSGDDPEPIYESGTGGEDEPVTGLDDPDLWVFRDRVVGAGGEEVHMFWDTADYTEMTIPVPDDIDPLSPGYLKGHVTHTYPRSGALAVAPDRVTVRVRVRPVALDLLDDLTDSGHLDPGIRGEMVVHDLLPNRHLGEDPAAPPELTSLGEVSHEFSEATRTVGNFTRTSTPTSMGTRECIGMPRRR